MLQSAMGNSALVGRSEGMAFGVDKLRPLKNAQFYSSSKKAKILTAGIH
jgi:hypothetical protein